MLLTGIFYAAVAVALALLVILPVFYVVNRIYDGGAGVTPLAIVVVVVWVVLARLLARRRIGL
jgi:hypothetical protein